MTGTVPEPTTYTLREYVKAPASDPYVDICAAEAQQVITDLLARAEVEEGTVPDIITARATREVGADLYFRRASRNGIATFGDAELAAVHINRDPTITAKTILRDYLEPPIG